MFKFKIDTNEMDPFRACIQLFMAKTGSLAHSHWDLNLSVADLTA